MKTVLAVVAVVAAVAIAVFAPELAPGLVSFLGSVGIGISTAVATALITATLTLAVGIALKLASKALTGGTPKASQEVGPPQVFRQSITDSFIVYGKRRVGGLLVFFHAKQSGSDHYRYFVIACAGHRCKQVDTWMLGDETVTVDGSGMVTSGSYANAAWLWFQRGQASETANSTFVAECDGQWTTAHKGDGIAAMYAKFKLTDAVVQAGMPNITAVIEGRDEIRDSRTGTTGYTRNAALIFYDWMAMLREEGGFGAYADEIPDDTWISAQANVCDETVNGNPRYAFDAVLTTGSPPGEVRDTLIVNCAGSYTFSNGKHLMRPGYWVPVSVTLKEGDLAGPLQITPFATSDAAATQVQGSYISPADGYQGMPFTTWTRPGTTDIRQLDLDLAFTTVRDQADRVAAIMGKRAACDKQVVYPMNVMGVGVTALDTVQLNTTRYGLNNYAWTVGNWGLSFDAVNGPSVVLTVSEINSEVFDDGSPATPVTPPTVTNGTTVLTLEEIQNSLRNTNSPDLTLSTAESGGVAAITFSDCHLQYPGLPSVAVTGTTLSSLATSSTFYAYCDVTGPGDASPTFGVTTVYSEALNSASHPYRIYLQRQIATPASGSGATGTGTGGGGGGSGGSNLLFSVDVFGSFGGTTFTDVTGTQSGTTPAGATSVTLSADLTVNNNGVSGSTPMELKFQRLISGTWTDEGTVHGSTILHGSSADFVWSFNDTGLSGSTAYSWRIVGRDTSGAAGMTVSGTFEATA